MIAVFLVLCFVTLSATAEDCDGFPRSRFEYEYNVLGKLRDHGSKLDDLKEADDAKHLALQQQGKDIDFLKEQRQTLDGSMYIRWGRTVCPDEGTELVYKGYAGGSWYKHKGGAANHLCLPEEPTWPDFTDNGSQGLAYIYGTEYEMTRGPISHVLNHEVPCAVCMSSRPRMIMIPGRTNCTNTSWTMEYNGYLVAGYYNQQSSSEYICLDGHPETVSISGNRANSDGNVIYHVQAQCGSLPCSVYPTGRKLACAVCTK